MKKVKNAVKEPELTADDKVLIEQLRLETPRNDRKRKERIINLKNDKISSTSMKERIEELEKENGGSVTLAVQRWWDSSSSSSWRIKATIFYVETDTELTERVMRKFNKLKADEAIIEAQINKKATAKLRSEAREKAKLHALLTKYGDIRRCLDEPSILTLDKNFLRSEEDEVQE